MTVPAPPPLPRRDPDDKTNRFAWIIEEARKARAERQAHLEWQRLHRERIFG